MPETSDLLLRHPVMDDWQGMYHNLWMHEESARYMLWDVTTCEEAAIVRMERSIRFQEGKSIWFVYEKETGQPIGFAGLNEIEPGIFEETGIAIGPAFVGKGYGKQLLNLLCRLAKEHGGTQFIACCREENAPSRGMILSCGFLFHHAEERIDPRNNTAYQLEFYRKNL